uniref:Cytochrome P450 n=1 Tax=Alexandrium andersonii TaxID=327968 RepID=A0A7S2F3C2_9DINO|mmetsp:Transcript_1548/g.3450  ORF Transcript_1548/g.3450 Transcript_1548/m.3450 type:complete len:557 (+) Transcript_1548:101-1771(+)
MEVISALSLQWGAALAADAKTIQRWLGYCAGASAVALTGHVLVLAARDRRKKRMLANVPFARYDRGSFLGFYAGMIANKYRLNEWRDEISRGLPVSKMFGLPAEPAGVVLIVRDPVLVKHFLKDNFENYTKAETNYDLVSYYLRAWLGAGIFTVRHGVGAEDGGHSWMKQRKIASAIFSRSNFNNNMQRVFKAKAEKLRALLAGPAEAGRRVDMQQQFFNFTMDSILQIFFGEQTDTLGGVPSQYASAYDAAHKNMMDYAVAALATVKPFSLLPWPIGGVGGLLWKLREAVSPLQWEFRRSCRTLDAESRRLVRACRGDPRLAERSDLLALFVKCEEEQQFSATFLRDVVLNFIIAGRDTTACTLTWMFYILATHPDIQAKLCEEVDAKCPRGSAPTFKQLSASEMPYLNAVLYETLRMYPPVPFDLKVAVQDDVLPDGTAVPAGAEMVFLPFAMGRDASIYPDPLTVNPKRWIPFVEPPPHEFPVFQAGPRICLGKDMAVFEAKLLACTLLQEYTFDLAQGEQEKITYSNTLTMSLCNSKTQDSTNLWLIPKARS